MSKYEREVDAGINFLDGDKPGWERDIDRNTLDLSSCENCIGGQLYGSYSNLINTARVFGPDYGFDIRFSTLSISGNKDDEWQRLQEIWESRIQNRLEMDDWVKEFDKELSVV